MHERKMWEKTKSTESKRVGNTTEEGEGGRRSNPNYVSVG